MSDTNDSREGGGVSTRVRDATFDIVKGISILEVMLHHLLSFSASRFSSEGSSLWWTMMMAHKVLHFAVPTFLLLSALLLAKSLCRTEQPDWKRFFKRRAERSLLPYLLWTAIYLGFRLRFVHVLREVQSVNLSLAGRTISVPALLLDTTEWRAILLWGKAWFHLYFLSVLLQFSLLTTLLFSIFKRTQVSFGAVVTVSALLQLFMFWLNATVLYPLLHFTTPASSVLWYICPTLIGTWLGFHWEEWSDAWCRTWVQIMLVCAVGLVTYIWLDLIESRGGAVNSYTYNSALTAYTTSMALILLRCGQKLGGGSTGKVLQRIGNWSLPLFLIHPMMLYFTGSPRIHALLVHIPFPVIVTGSLVFCATWGLTWLIMSMRLDKLFFGRRLSSASGD